MLSGSDVGMLVALWMTTAFPAVLAVMTRALVRICYDRRKKPFIIAADVLIGLSFVCNIEYCTGMSLLILYGLIQTGGGRDPNAVPIDNGTTGKALEIGYFTGVFYYLGLYAAKGAVISLLYSIIPPTRLVHRRFLFVATCFIVVSGLWTMGTNLFGCWPLKNNWALTTENCYSYRIPYIIISCSALIIITDLILIALPMPLLRGLRISVRQKVGLGSLFCLGIFCVFSTMMRLILVYGPQDPNNNPSSLVWSGIEMSTSICVACAPAVRTFVARRTSSNINNSGGSAESPWRRWMRSRSRENRTQTGVAELDRTPYDLIEMARQGTTTPNSQSSKQVDSSQKSSQATVKTQTVVGEEGTTEWNAR